MKNGDMNAAPMDSISAARQEDGFHDPFAYGLTKRERFAMAAMQGDWAAQSDLVGEFVNAEDTEARSKIYVAAADSLLKALEEH